MLAWYGIGAALAAGSSISSGLFIPMMMIGALIGRLVGLGATDLVDLATEEDSGELNMVCCAHILVHFNGNLC